MIIIILILLYCIRRLNYCPLVVKQFDCHNNMTIYIYNIYDNNYNMYEAYNVYNKVSVISNSIYSSYAQRSTYYTASSYNMELFRSPGVAEVLHFLNIRISL